MPINLDTINLLYDKNFTAEEAKVFIDEEIKKDIEKYHITEPQNFEEKGITSLAKNFIKPLSKTTLKNSGALTPKTSALKF